MKTAIKIIGMVIIFLTAGSMLLNAQNGKGRAANRGGYCLNLPDLSEKQKTELTSLSVKHQAEMDALRTDMRSTNDANKKSEVSSKMNSIRDSHRAEVLSLLTDKQKESFNAGCQANGGRMMGKNGKAGNCYGNGKGGMKGSGFRNGRS